MLLINWIYAKPPGERRLIVMHNDEAVLLGGARGSIVNKWDQWRKEGILRWIPQFPASYSWAELKRELGEMS